MTAISAIAIRMIFPHQFRITRTKYLSVRVGVEAKRAQCLSIIVGKRFPILARPRFPHPFLKPSTDGIDRHGKVLPARRWRGRVRRQRARFPFPSGLRTLPLLHFIGSHSGEVIISLDEFKTMVKDDPAPYP